MTDPHAPTTKDGFRPRKKRPKGWMKQAIKDGVIADPKQGIPERVPGERDHVVDVPIAKVTAEQE
jgi:hypothetical protein